MLIRYEDHIKQDKGSCKESECFHKYHTYTFYLSMSVFINTTLVYGKRHLHLMEEDIPTHTLPF